MAGPAGIVARRSPRPLPCRAPWRPHGQHPDGRLPSIPQHLNRLLDQPLAVRPARSPVAPPQPPQHPRVFSCSPIHPCPPRQQAFCRADPPPFPSPFRLHPSPFPLHPCHPFPGRDTTSARALSGCSSMVERGPPMPEARVRFPSPAPSLKQLIPMPLSYECHAGTSQRADNRAKNLDLARPQPSLRERFPDDFKATF